MCSKTETKEMVYEAFNEDNGLRHEIQQDVKTELRSMLWQFLVVYGVTMVGAIIAGTIFITQLRSDVDRLLSFADSGERFTTTDAELLQVQIETNANALQNVAQRQDLQRVEETLIRLDERLRNQGI